MLTAKAVEPSNVRCDSGQRILPKLTPHAAAKASPTPISKTPDESLKLSHGLASDPRKPREACAVDSNQTGMAQPSKRYKCVRTKSPLRVSSRLSRYRPTKLSRVGARPGTRHTRQVSSTMKSRAATNKQKPRNSPSPAKIGGIKSATARAWKAFLCSTLRRVATPLPQDAAERTAMRWMLPTPTTKMLGHCQSKNRACRGARTKSRSHTKGVRSGLLAAQPPMPVSIHTANIARVVKPASTGDQ
mmetsp:Transcript_34977/g.113317  ORF Transcript_34977/g.113317 Transcript_34977/m.113317 type:complete len:245 (+) Transcript_34977:266-1000(+)